MSLSFIVVGRPYWQGSNPYHLSKAGYRSPLGTPVRRHQPQRISPQFMKILCRLVQGLRFLALKDGATRKLKRWNPEEIPNLCETCGGFARRLPMHVIDRQLLQRHFLGFAQFYDTLHPLPGH
ncbi:hypothetical protein, partial [Paraburkholderia sprentiae]